MFYSLPKVTRPEDVNQRKYLMRVFKIDLGSEGYGLILDIDARGQVVTAIGFVAYRIIF